jgi:mannose-6-phosphate isomerase-like protein (cupin superfamily)
MADFDVVEVGEPSSWDDIDGVRPGKLFVEKDLAAKYLGMSVNSMAPGDQAPFWHTHSQHEELYIFLSGQGQLALDDEVVDVQAGTIVRVGTGTWRAWRALSDSSEPLRWLCVRSGGATLQEIGRDGEMDAERAFPWATTSSSEA